MKTIHLKCGHNITVREWPSKIGLAKVRHHYKKFHPTRMKKITKKSLATKRQRGLIKNRCNPKVKFKKLKLLKRHRVAAEKADKVYKEQLSEWTKASKRFNNPKNHNPPGELIYDRLLEIHAQKQHGKFKGENFVHDFKRNTDAVVIGNKDGSLTIKSKRGKRLWRKFNY